MNQSKGLDWKPQVGEELDNAQLQGIRFSPIPPQSRQPGTMQENRGLFIRNVPREMNNKELKQLFSEHGHVVSVFLKSNGPEAKFNWAIINTETVKDMLAIMSAMNRKPPFNFEITVALSEDEKRQRKKGRGEPIPTHNMEGLSIVQRDMETHPTQVSSSLIGQKSWNGAEGLLKTPWPPVNECNTVFEAGQGVVMVEGRRRQACVLCRSQGQLRCSVCKAWYCSMACQVDDWYHHKNTCRSPPILDDPHKMKMNVAVAGGEALRNVSSNVVPSITSSTYFSEKNIRKEMQEEVDLCSSPKNDTLKMLPTREMGTKCKDTFEGFPKMNSMSEGSYSVGKGAALIKGIEKPVSCGVGRGAIPKTNSVVGDNKPVGGCDIKGRTAPENGSVTKEAAAFLMEPSKDSKPKISHVETTVNVTNERSVTLTKDSEYPSQQQVKEKSVNGVSNTCGESSRKQTPSVLPDTTHSSNVLSSNSVTEHQLNFSSLLEEGKVYNGFITMLASHEQFTAVVVVEGTEYIFNEAHEILSTSPTGNKFKPEIHSLVAAYSPLEETWYRARILQTDGSKYRVCYVDFGNKETVEQVKPIPEGPFSELPELAFLAKLCANTDEKICEKLKEIVEVNNPIKFKVIAKKGLCVKVSLCQPEDEEETPFAEYILRPLLMPPASTSVPSTPASKTDATPCTEEENSTPNTTVNAVTSLQETSLTQKEKTSVEMHDGEASHKETNEIDIPDKEQAKECISNSLLAGDANNKLVSSEGDKTLSCFVVPMKNVDLILKLEEVSVKMNQQCDESPAAAPYHPSRGEACLAKFTEDSNWYRALCITPGSSCSQVIFVDYGNTENVSHSDIRPIPREFLALPCMALYLTQQEEEKVMLEEQKGQVNILQSFTLLSTLTFPSEGKINLVK